MDDANADSPEELTSREPSLEDLVELCRELNSRNADYVIIGGFAIRAAGYARNTGDVDVLIESSRENEAKVYLSLESLPDQAVRQLNPGDVARHTVVRVADEIVVDLMASASGIDFSEAKPFIDYREINGVVIPFASPEILWRMKRRTHREKDAPDLQFLRHWFEANGVPIPEN